MSTNWLVVAVAVLVAGIGCSTLDSRAPVASQSATDTGGQILVMLKESSIRHYTPGVTAMGSYGSASASSPQMRTAKDLAREYGFRLVSDWAMPALGIRCFLAVVERSHVPAEVAARLTVDPRVESAQPVQVFHVLGHNDAYYELQVSAMALRLDQLHQMATGKNVRVAAIDTGVDLKHPDLDGQLSRARNFVDGTDYVAELHGTAVAGIIVAKADNAIGIVGIAPAATLMPLRACWQSGADPRGALCSSFTLAKAIQYALIQRAHVLNLSLTGPRDQLLERLIDKAIEQGVTVIGAIDPAAPAESFPATHRQVIAVASASTSGMLDGVILAPGDDVLTTTPNASWGFVSGTSFAAAHVTGIAALLLQLSPSLKPTEISSLLHDNAHSPGTGGPRILNACAMLAQLSKTRDCHCCEALASPRGRRPLGIPAS